QPRAGDRHDATRHVQRRPDAGGSRQSRGRAPRARALAYHAAKRHIAPMTFRSPAPMLVALALAAGASGLALAQAAPATTQPKTGGNAHNSNAPIDWVANRIEVQDQQHRAVLTGAGRVVQGEMK